MRRSFTSLLALGAAACGGSQDAVAQLKLSSPAFAAGSGIPARFTCDGAGLSPPLAWSDPPAGTKSYALIVDDPDAPGGTFRHWGIFDLPAGTRSIAAGSSAGTAAMNDFGKPGYGGPCPPSGAHHYRFKLYALDVPALDLSPGTKIAALESAAETHAIGRAEITGLYQRRKQ